MDETRKSEAAALMLGFYHCRAVNDRNKVRPGKHHAAPRKSVWTWIGNAMKYPALKSGIISNSILASAICLAFQAGAIAQDQSQPTTVAPAPAATSETVASPAPNAVAKPFTQVQLRTLLAPIALYSDSLLAQILPASAYPIDIVSASRWLAENQAAVAKDDFSRPDAERWDPSVKALLRFPIVLDKMNAQISWTKDLGDAFVAQPEDVAAMIQTLRKEAQTAGSLKSSKAQAISTEKQGGSDVIVIRDAEPGVIYVPTYDPVAAYQPGYNLLGFGVGIATAAIISNNYWNWNRGWAYPGRWAGYPGYRRNTNTVIRNTDINIRNGWQPNPERVRGRNRVDQPVARPGGATRNGRVSTLPSAKAPRANARRNAEGPGARNARAGGGRVERGGGSRVNRGGGARHHGARHTPRRVGRRR